MLFAWTRISLFLLPLQVPGYGSGPAGSGGPVRHEPTPDALLDLEFGNVYTRESEGLGPAPSTASGTRGRDALRCVVTCGGRVHGVERRTTTYEQIRALRVEGGGGGYVSFFHD